LLPGSYNAQLLLAESPERLARRNLLVARKETLVEGLRYFGEHAQQFEANGGVEAAPTNLPGSFTFQGQRASNYQRPSAASPRSEDMEDVGLNNLPLRHMSITT
jgi:hypothetical protein